MNVPAHDWHRLAHSGFCGLERRERAERRYQLALCFLLTVALIAVYWAVGGI